MQVKTKVQKLKDTRDYSFLLSEDAEFPAPAKEPPPRNLRAPNSGVLLIHHILSVSCYMGLEIYYFH